MGDAHGPPGPGCVIHLTVGRVKYRRYASNSNLSTLGIGISTANPPACLHAATVICGASMTEESTQPPHRQIGAGPVA